MTAFVLGGPHPASADAKTPVTTTGIVSMLSTYESMPSRDEWLALGDDAIPILIAIVADEEEVSFRRVRALTVLGYFPGPVVTQTLARVAEDTAAPGAFRRAALLSLASRDMARAMPILASVLAAPEPLMRQVAVKALAQSENLDARRMLQQHRNREQEGFLVEAIDRALASPPP